MCVKNAILITTTALAFFFFFCCQRKDNKNSSHIKLFPYIRFNTHLLIITEKQTNKKQL